MLRVKRSFDLSEFTKLSFNSLSIQVNFECWQVLVRTCLDVGGQLMANWARVPRSYESFHFMDWKLRLMGELSYTIHCFQLFLTYHYKLITNYWDSLSQKFNASPKMKLFSTTQQQDITILSNLWVNSTKFHCHSSVNHLQNTLQKSNDISIFSGNFMIIIW